MQKAFVERLEQRPVARLALAERRLGAHALGDVAREERDTVLLGRVGVHLEVDVSLGAGEVVGEVHVHVVALDAPELQHHLALRVFGQHVQKTCAPPTARAGGRTCAPPPRSPLRW
jgi:hypothetical protein